MKKQTKQSAPRTPFVFDNFFAKLVAHKEKFGNLNVSYKENKTLYMQMVNVRRGRIKITEQQKQQLTDIGFPWEVKIGRKCSFDFDKFCKNIVKFKAPDGMIYIPSTETNLLYQSGNIRSGIIKLTDEQKQYITELGFVWDTKKFRKQRFDFNKFCQDILPFKSIDGKIYIPNKEKTYHIYRQSTNVRLGKIRLSDKEKQYLTDMGFVWDNKRCRKNGFNFNEFYDELIEYKLIYGNVNVPFRMTKKQFKNPKLGLRVYWVRHGKTKITEEQRKLLDDIGFNWTPERKISFDEFYQRLLKCIGEDGKIHIPKDDKVLRTRIKSIKSGIAKLTDKQKELLNKIGFDWNKNKPIRFDFEKFYNELVEHKKHYGSLKNIHKNQKLATICSKIRCGHITITEEQRKLLDELGFNWEKKKVLKMESFKFDKFYQNWLEYFSQTQDIFVPFNKTINNYEIGYYARQIRCKNIELTEQQISTLEDSGFVFDTSPFIESKTNDTDTLIKNMLWGDMTARLKITERFYNFAFYSVTSQGGILTDDIKDYITQEYLEAIDRFPSKDKDILNQSHFMGFIKKTVWFQYCQYKIAEKTNQKMVISLSLPTGKDKDKTFGDFLPDRNHNGEKDALDASFRMEIINKMKNTLNKAECIAVSLYFGFNKYGETMTTKQIAEKYNTSEDKVSKALVSAIKKLKATMKKEDWNME